MRESDRRLCAYFDGELDSGERQRFEAELAADFSLRQRLDAWTVMRGLVVGEAELEQRDLSDARFEQVWGNVERELDRDAIPSEGEPSRPSLADWGRRVWPVLAAAGVAVLALMVWPDDDPAPPDQAAPSIARPGLDRGHDVPDAGSTKPDRPAPTDDGAIRVADAFPLPESSDVQIERIEFGGDAGRIAQIQDVKGSTTVIWVDDPQDTNESDRSL